MKATIRDTRALNAVSPVALAAYAQSEGWIKGEPYGDYSNVYAAHGLPEIILPLTRQLGDYAYVVSELIEIFASVAEMDELSLYRNLITADRDVLRVRAEGEDDGALSVNDGIDLLSGARDMFLAAACSLKSPPRPVYRLGANKEANNYMRHVRLGQTEQGSFVITMLTPPVSPTTQQRDSESFEYNDPFGRRVTARLSEALSTTPSVSIGSMESEAYSLSNAMRHGISANFCEALAQMVKPFPALDVSLAWARTRPRNNPRSTFRFVQNDAPKLTEVANLFRSREPKPNVRLSGLVQRLERDGTNARGTVVFKTTIDKSPASIKAVFDQKDYAASVQAHLVGSTIVVTGDLERIGQRWHMLNPSIKEVITQDLHKPAHYNR